MVEFDAGAVAAAAAGCPSVLSLSSGASGTVATYLPGRRVDGIRELDGGVEVHVVARWAVPISELAREVRGAVRGLVGAGPVHVIVDDIEDPPVAQRTHRG